jgi:hypothetical protein
LIIIIIIDAIITLIIDAIIIDIIDIDYWCHFAIMTLTLLHIDITPLLILILLRWLLMIIDYYDIISLPFRLIILMPLRHATLLMLITLMIIYITPLRWLHYYAIIDYWRHCHYWLFWLLTLRHYWYFITPLLIHWWWLRHIIFTLISHYFATLLRLTHTHWADTAIGQRCHYW